MKSGTLLTNYTIGGACEQDGLSNEVLSPGNVLLSGEVLSSSEEDEVIPLHLLQHLQVMGS